MLRAPNLFFVSDPHSSNGYMSLVGLSLSACYLRVVVMTKFSRDAIYM